MTRHFKIPEHAVIADLLASMDAEMLLDAGCFFGGGTAIVMMLDEYRQSLDVDFLCADSDGFRRLRTAAVEHGIRAFFPEPVETVRVFRTDQYGLRAAVRLHGQTIKVEIVREARIVLEGQNNAELGVPLLVPVDMFAEKLLANADRCYDRSAAYRDAFDLGMLIGHFGPIPDEAVAKVTHAYGSDIERKVAGVVRTLQDHAVLRHAAESLRMDVALAETAIDNLAREGHRLWPSADLAADIGPS